MAEAAAAPAFETVLRPHRSLEPAGFRVVMAVAGGAGLATGLGFWAVGAWPVLGFLGLDVLGLYLAFRLSYRAARRWERIRLAGDAVTVERSGHGGRAQVWTFPAFWLRVEMDDPPRPESELALVSHGRRLVIGRFLGPGERSRTAAAIADALARYRRGLAPG